MSVMVVSEDHYINKTILRTSATRCSSTKRGVVAEKPDGVPPENWLPVNRGDYGIDLIMPIYAPDLARFKTWRPPMAERIQ